MFRAGRTRVATELRGARPEAAVAVLPLGGTDSDGVGCSAAQHGTLS